MSAPDGFVRVPREPTREMISAGNRVAKMDVTGAWIIDPEECYSAMLAAAPVAGEESQRSEAASVAHEQKLSSDEKGESDRAFQSSGHQTERRSGVERRDLTRPPSLFNYRPRRWSKVDRRQSRPAPQEDDGISFSDTGHCSMHGTYSARAGKLCPWCHQPDSRPDGGEIVLDDGKYRFYKNANGALYCDRYGESWREFIGDHAVTLLFEAALRAAAKEKP